jgi:hypothetical protein
MRFFCVLAVGVALAGLVAFAPRVAAQPASATSAAFIDLGPIFSGDENEPDENEAGDGDAARRRPAQGGGKSISVVGVVVSATIGAIAALFVASRLRRLRDRLQRWRYRSGVTPDRRR